MTVTKQITVQQMLDMYGLDQVYDLINVKVGQAQRIYGKTRVDAGDKAEGFIVVWCEV